MKILFIVNEYNSANGICVQGIIKEMINAGYDVSCITNDEPHSCLVDGVEFAFVKPRLCYRLLNSKSGIQNIAGKILNKLKLLFSYPTWPLISPLYTYRIYKQAKKICDKKKIDIIIPVYTQIDALIAAEKIKRKNSDIKYIPYFLDSFSGGYGPKQFSKDWIIKRGIKWEDKLLPLADKIIMMQSSYEHYYKSSKNKEYFKKIEFLDLPLIIKPSFLSKEKTDNLIHLVYVGSIPAYIRNPEPFLQVFSKTKNKNFRLHIIGTSTCGNMLKAYAGKDSRIILEGQITHEEAMARIGQADVLVNLGNNVSTMTPSKIFEYISCGKPIISTMPIPDEPSAEYLKKYPLSFLIDYGNTDLEKTAEELEKWILGNVGKSADYHLVESIFKKNMPEYFIDSVISTII